MKQSLFSFLLLLFAHTIGTAQTTSIKIVDAATGEAIPYANIMVNTTENLVSNAEGNFTLSQNNISDNTPIVVSYIGYAPAQTTVGSLKDLDNTIKLLPGIVELDEVHVSNVRPNIDSIMAAVKRNLKVHYKGNGLAFKDQLFVRTGSGFYPKKMDIEITKSTGYSKQQLKESNSELRTFTNKLIQHPPYGFNDMLCNYYTALVEKDGKKVFVPRLEVIKATTLKNGDQPIDLDNIDDMGKKVFMQHLDKNKYYRIKSGWFGSRDTISLKKGFSIGGGSKKQPVETPLAKSKSDLMNFLYRNNFMQNEKFEFLTELDDYNYTYEGRVYKSDDDYVYVVSFSPDRRSAKYTGKLYISVDDYAIVRCDYNLAEGKTLSGFNMKFLLGVKSSENVSKGTIMYKKNPEGAGYYLHYASMETGQYLYINRPLKFIELSKEEGQVAFDFTVEGNINTKTEYLNMSRVQTTDAAVEQQKEPEFTVTTLKRYDPSIWKDYSVIEPLNAMKQLKAEE
jgi:hypothetical protein